MRVQLYPEAESGPSPLEFARRMLRQDILKYQRRDAGDDLVFHDRGIVDALSMIDPLERLQETRLNGLLAAYPYHHQAFVLPPWEAICKTDAERDQSLAEAVAPG